MGSAAAAMPHQPFRWVPTSSKVGPTSISLISTAASLRLGHLLLHTNLDQGFFLQSSFKKLCDHLPRLKDVWCEKAFQFKKMNLFELPNDGFAYCMCFFNGGRTRKDLDSSRGNSFGERPWTNVLLAINVLMYIAQFASQGKLLLWGAKINSLIDEGQLWRLATSSFLHANIGHLLINCYSLNSIGPGMEDICGPKRYLAIYFTSAITSSAVSYWFCKAPAVGASGAIFGLVGSLAVFVMRHRGLLKGGKEHLQHIAQVIFLNMAIGLLSKGIDNWGHLGGLLGGAATSWLLGPVWKYKSPSNDS